MSTDQLERPTAPASPPPSGPDVRSDVREGAGLGARIAIAALSFLVLLCSGLSWSAYKDFSANVPRGAAVPAGGPDPDGAAQNILLLGNDTRQGATPAELSALSTGMTNAENTDTMMMLHIPANGSGATVVSFPRDSWVSIRDHGNGKLNSAYGWGYGTAHNAGLPEDQRRSAGILEIIKTLEDLTGMHIDHYLQVSLLGFYRISNAIGGVEVCLNKAQNAKTDRDDKGSGYSGINLPKGVSVIKGKQALAFVRQRHGLPQGDLSRIARQQYFLQRAFEKIASKGVLLNPFKMSDLLGAVSSSLFADPSLDFVSLSRTLALISSGSVRFETIPNNGAQLIYPDGVETSIVEIDKAAIPSFFKQLEGQKTETALAHVTSAAPGNVTLDVLNGTMISGRAQRNADALNRLGFKIAAVDSADSEATATMVRYPKGMEAAAKAVIDAVPGAKPVETDSLARVTLVLGGDEKQVSTLSSGGSGRGVGARPLAAPPSSNPPIPCID